jgi:nitrite reductase (NADH) small subunit
MQRLDRDLPGGRHPGAGLARVSRPRGIDVAVFRNSEDQVFALLDRCPHKGGPLSQGIVFGTSVACPLHNWTIGLDDGCAKAPDEGCTPKFSVQGGKRARCMLDPVELATQGAGPHAPQVAGPPCALSLGCEGDPTIARARRTPYEAEMGA